MPRGSAERSRRVAQRTGGDMLWWSIPIVATLCAWIYTRLAGSWRGRARRRPEPGSPEDQRELARFGAAISRRVPGERR